MPSFRIILACATLAATSSPALAQHANGPLLSGPQSGAAPAPGAPNVLQRSASSQRLCAMFRHDADGSWTTLHGMTMGGPSGKVHFDQGVSFRAGAPVQGLDLGRSLDQSCTAQ